MTKDYLARQFKNYHEITGDVVTPEMFGAKGDGVTDDTQAFTDAFAASKNVICDSSKRYYFNGIVDASSLVDGELNINNATLLNFHIKVGIKEVYKPVQNYPGTYFTIKNGVLGDYYNKPQNWQTPVIQSGNELILSNLLLRNTPYLLAMTNSYRDNMKFENIGLSFNAELWTNITWSLDAITVIKADGTFARFNNLDIESIPTDSQGIAGDGWIIDRVNEFRDYTNSGYCFARFYRNQPMLVSRCIQTKFYIARYSKVTFLNCHFENELTFPEIGNLPSTDSSLYTGDTNTIVKFDGCYFYNTYILETNKPYVSYISCYFRTCEDANDNTVPFAYSLNNTDYYDVKCSIINCRFAKTVVTSQDFKNYRAESKITRSWNNGDANYEHLMKDKIVATKTLASGTYKFPEIGIYNYTGFTFTNSAMIAHETYSWQRTIDNIDSESDRSSNLNGLTGGWGFEIYRTLPSGEIQRARFFDNPQIEDGGTNILIGFEDCGMYFVLHRVLIKSSENIETYVNLPWITVDTIPTYTVNDKVYEKKGVLVTIDNSVISNIGSTSKQTQVYDKFTDNTSAVASNAIYKVTALPVASATYLNRYYILTANQTGYTKDVVYTCKEVTPSTDPATYHWVAVTGTASLKNSTDRVSPNNTDLVESQSVYSAINTALSSIYTPRGEITCAELTSSLLIAANVGNVYETSDSGTTTALFLQGAGHPIATGDNVGIINAGEGRILFNLMANAFDLTGYQKKDLTQAVEGATTVEGALGALSTNKADKTDITYKNKSLTTTSVDDFGATLVANGVGSYSGTVSVNGTWYNYQSIIQGDLSGSWYGNAILWGDSGNFYTFRKGYSASTTWTQKKFVTDEIVPSNASASNKLVTAEITGGNNGAFLNTTPILTYLRSLPITIKIASFNVSPSYAEVTDKIDTVHWFQYICNRAGDSAQEWTIHATSLDGTLEYIGKIQSSTTEISWQKLVTESDIIVKKGTWEGSITLQKMGDSQTKDRFDIPITFDSPMPDYNYTVIIEFFEGRYITVRAASKTASGFHIEGANCDNNATSTVSKITWTAIRFPS